MVEPQISSTVMFSIVANNITGHLIQGSKHAQKTSKLYLTFGIFLNLATLGYFKYANFFLEMWTLSSVQFQHADIILPLAIFFSLFSKSPCWLISTKKRQSAQLTQPLTVCLLLSAISCWTDCSSF